MCILPWIPGIITSKCHRGPHDGAFAKFAGFTGLGLGVYGPVSGNWCWIQSQYLGLRYGLTHGWRIAIFLTTVTIYTCIYIKLRRLFSSLQLALSSSPGTASNRSRTGPDTIVPSDSHHIWITTTVEASYELESRSASGQDQGKQGPNNGKTQRSAYSIHRPPSAQVPCTNTTQQSSNTAETSRSAPASPNLKKMMLLNGYPIAYIILWIPGMANRLAESLGTSPPWLTSLQSCTQFIGMVNALTYGFTEQMQRAIQVRMKKRSFRALDTE